MLRIFQRCGWMLLLAALVSSVRAFSLLGSPDTFQTATLGYGGDLGDPMNLGEEYRYNVPVLYYAYDRSFLDYFGSNGVLAVEQAISILSNHLSASNTSFSVLSSDLSEFPLSASRNNYRAQALSLIDLKTQTLGTLVEELGLANPARWTWCLRARIPIPPGCPNFEYHVIMRNFDPVTWEPSRYVNGALFTYHIVESCPAADQAVAVDDLVDPYADRGAGPYGELFTALTRDDMGGFRYLWRANNINAESIDPASTWISGGFTNRDVNAQQLVTSQDYSLLWQMAQTNDAATLQALYPGLAVDSTSNYWGYVVTSNLTSYFDFDSGPWGSPSDPPHLVQTYTYTTNVARFYQHTFLNIITNYQYKTGSKIITNSMTQGSCITTLSTSSGDYAWAVPNSGTISNVFATVYNATTVCSTNGWTGDFFIIPTNQCGFSIVSMWLTNVIATTNQTLNVTNTSNSSTTNSTLQVTYFTNHTVAINPVYCDAPGFTNGVALRQGMDRIYFVRHDYDSLLGKYWSPMTTNYTSVAVQGNQLVPQVFRRVVSQPDILFYAQDLDIFTLERGINLYNGDVAANYNDGGAHAGPGTIRPGFSVGFNKVGPLLINEGPDFMYETNAVTNFVWASFDTSTNEPVIYPSGTSIVSLENQILMQITTSALPDATNGAAYPPVTLTGSGGTQSYTWSLASYTMSGWPAGISLTSGGVISSGTNVVATTNVPGIYDITVQMTDTGGRSVVRDFTLTVH